MLHSRMGLCCWVCCWTGGDWYVPRGLTLCGSLQAHVQSLKGLCQGLNDLTLLRLQRDGALTLQDFCTAQAEVQALGKTRLATFGDAASTAVVLACQAAAEMLAVRLTEFHSRQVRVLFPTLFQLAASLPFYM
jgi:hypothetical protein